MGAMQQMLQGSAGLDVDPYFANVALLLHMDDANPTDYAPVPKGGSRSGCSVSTAQQQFGTGSFVFNGPASASYIEYANNAIFNFGTGDFTFECWLRLAAAPATPKILYESGNSPYTTSGGLQVFVTTSRTVSCGAAFVAPLIAGATVLALNTWYYIATARIGTSWVLWINGALEGSVTSAVSLNATGTTTIGGSARSSADCINGYIDELRVTKGVGRYSGSTITIPTGPFANQ